MIWILFGSVCFLVVSLWGVWAGGGFALSDWFTGGADPNNAGLWGDSFAPLNTLFAALGFAGVVGAVFLQTRALSTQQKDQHKQRFDSSFFELLRLAREARNELTFYFSEEFIAADGHATDQERKGQEAFRAAYYEARYWILSETEDLTADRLGAIYRKRIHDRRETSG